MEFKYKGQNEIDAMTPEQVDIYMEQKRAFEENATKEQINEALKNFNIEKIEAFENLAQKLDTLQEKYNVMLEKNDQKSLIEKGTFVDFVEKNISNFDVNDKHYGANTVIKVAALMTTANITPSATGGMTSLFGNYIDTEIGHVPRPENIMLSIVSVTTQQGTEAIYYSDRINEEGDAQFIAEGALKPLADAEYKESKEPIKEVAVRWKFTKRLLMHAPAIVADFLEHAYQLVNDKIDGEILNGDGLTTNLSGLTTKAAAWVVPPALAGYYTNANIFDVIMAVGSSIDIKNFTGKQTVILNPIWRAKMAGVKDSLGQYVIPPFVTPDGRNVGGITVKFSNRLAVDKIVQGDMSKFRVVFAENIMYDEGYENDDFSKNLVSRKLEAFLGTYIKASDAGSIVYGDIDDILEDIDNTAIPSL